MAPQLSRLERERIVAMWGAGLRVKQIENETGITRKTILYWIRRNEETGGDLTPHHRQLYQRATTANEDGAIVAAHTANPFRSTALTAADYNSKPGEVTQAVKDAIDVGYRHIDCAYVYCNEKEVGEAISTKISEGVVKREDLFITSKLWNSFHRPDLVEGVLRKSLEDLKVSYLDLYLIHFPFAYKEDGELFPYDSNGKIQFSDVDYLDSWKEMEKLVTLGLVKSIGVSNFNKRQLTRLLENCVIKPVTNQVECHPYLNQKRLADFMRPLGIVLTAYSPLGSPDRPWAKPGEPHLLEDPKLKDIAAKYGKSVAQILIRYQLERGHVVIPKSVTKSRIASNFDVFDFKLNANDIAVVDQLDCNGRFVPITAAFGHKDHPFEHDEY